MTITDNDIQAALAAFGMNYDITGKSELLRYDCKPEELFRREFKLILRLDLAGRSPVVLKIYGGDERDKEDAVESMCRFSEILRENGFETPRHYMSGGKFAITREFDGCLLTVTLEDFVENEIKRVNEHTAYLTGRQLARTHDISEKNDCHVKNEVIFDFFAANDLFDVDEFRGLAGKLPEKEKERAVKLIHFADDIYAKLAPIRFRPKYAVQGDISDCNTYLTPDGNIGFFDYNCAGENILFADAVMQGWFEAHLMDYGTELTDEMSDRIAREFFRGYREVRPFTDEETAVLPGMYALISAFAKGNNRYAMTNAVKEQDTAKIDELLDIMEREIPADRNIL